MNKETPFLIYNIPDGEGRIQVVGKGGTIRCTQKAMAQLFYIGVPAISKHLNLISEEGELSKDTTVSKMEIVVNRDFRGGIKDKMVFYNLDTSIAVSYSVSSLKATRIRQWPKREHSRFTAIFLAV